VDDNEHRDPNGIQMSRYLCILTILLLPAFTAADLQTAAQYETDGEYQLAIDTYQQVIDQIVAETGEYSVQLFEPLLGQGRSLSALNRNEAATDALQQAQHMLRRNEGVYTLRQIEVIDQLTSMAMKDGDPDRANTQQKFSFFISERFYGQDHLAVFEATSRMASWYLETGQLTKGLTLTTKMIKDLEETHKNHPRLIDAYILAAKFRRLKGACCVEKHLSKVLEILDSNPDLPVDVKSQVYLELADTFLVSRKQDKAEAFYAKVDYQNAPPQLISMTKELHKPNENRQTVTYRPEESLFSSNQMTRMTREELLSSSHVPPQQFSIPQTDNEYNFQISNPLEVRRADEKIKVVIGKPFQFYYDQLRTLLPLRLKKDDALNEVQITLDFTVKNDGSLENIEILETNAPVKVNKLMREVLSKVKYRPALTNGVPVTREHISLTQTFIKHHET